MIITLNTVIGNGRHQGRSIREVMDSDPQFIIQWISMAPAMRMDKETIDYWFTVKRNYEKSKQLQAEVFHEVEERE